MTKAQRRERRKRRRRQKRKRKQKQRRLRERLRRRRKKKHKNVLRAMMGLSIEGQGQGPNKKRRLQWTRHSLGDKPPFETLLSSDPLPQESPLPPPPSPNNETQEVEIDNYGDFDPHTYDQISSSDLFVPRKGRQRTPLPLKEADEDQRGWKRRKRK